MHSLYLGKPSNQEAAPESRALPSPKPPWRLAHRGVKTANSQKIKENRMAWDTNEFFLKSRENTERDSLSPGRSQMQALQGPCLPNTRTVANGCFSAQLGTPPNLPSTPAHAFNLQPSTPLSCSLGNLLGIDAAAFMNNSQLCYYCFV